MTPGPNSPLSQVIDHTELVNLAHDQNSFSIEFTTLSFRSPATNRYRYRLEGLEDTMLLSNGPQHRQRRAPMARAFGHRVVEALRPRIRSIANELIDEVIANEEMNLLDQYAALIPARLISEILGIAVADVPRFTSWVYSLSRALSVSYLPSEIPEIEAATLEFRNYVDALLEERRRKPRQDFLSSFLTIVEEQGVLSATEAAVQVMTVIVGGSDTTRAALTILVKLLLQHREQWEAVCRDPFMVQGAVTEGLRYDAVIGSVPRFAVQDIPMDGYVLPANSIVSVSTLSMLRDPDVYANPDEFDIWRIDHVPRHPIFGGGAHRCLGESLARAELEEGLAVLSHRLPSLQMTGEPPVLLGHSGLRRVTPMHVTWSMGGQSIERRTTPESVAPFANKVGRP